MAISIYGLMVSCTLNLHWLVGRARHEHKLRGQYMSQSDAIVYFVNAMSICKTYDLIDTKFAESIAEFEYIANCKAFCKLRFILVFTHCDIFVDQFETWKTYSRDNRFPGNASCFCDKL